MITVLIVDDSLTTRQYLRYIIDGDPLLQVAGEARSGHEAVEKAREIKPDVAIMDIQMPGMDGYAATRKIMETQPLPIIMYSPLVAPAQTKNIFKAMQAGAVAVAEKPPGPGSPQSRPLIEKLLHTVKLMAEVKVVRRHPVKAGTKPPRAVDKLLTPENLTDIAIVVIGASTGGPPVLHHILTHMPGDFPIPIAIVQHIAAGFLPGMVDWLSKETRLTLKIAGNRDILSPGEVCFAPEDDNMAIESNGRISIRRAAGTGRHKRPITCLFESVANTFGPRAVGILLTGMGSDGAAGLLEMIRRGAQTVVQDRETSTVFGMPAEAIKLDAAQYVMSPVEITDFMKSLGRAKAGA